MAIISKSGIGTGNTIQAEHITRIIDALNGTGSADIIATGSFTGSFNGSADIWTVQDLTVFGTASINYFETIYETSSIIYQSGSTKFGNSADDTHQFTGSVFIDGDTQILGNTTATGSFSGSFVGDGSGLTGIISASYAPNFANTDLTFTGTRTHDLSGNSLSLMNGGGIQLSGSGIFNQIRLKHDTNTLSIQSARTAFNPGNADINFQVGTVGTDYALNVDGGTDRVSINKINPNATLDVNGDTIISGSLNVTEGITGSYTGSFVGDGAGLYNIPASGITGLNLSQIASGSATASIAPNTGFRVNTDSAFTGSMTISGSASPALSVIGSGSAVFTVNGSVGEIFSVSDSLSGSLFAVNDASGFPIFEVFSDETINYGSNLAPALTTTVKNTVSSAGVFTVYSLPTASYDGAWFEYVAKSGSDARAGQIMSLWSGTAVNFTETTTTDFGDTSGLSFTVAVSGSNFALTGSVATAGWTIKTIVRSI